MSFERTEMTCEEINYVRTLEIQNPVNSYYGFDKTSGTIDRDRNIYLFGVGNDHWEPIDEVYFVFIWRNICIVPLLRKKYSENNSIVDSVIWSIVKITIPRKVEKNYDEIISDLKEALIVYAYDGSPNPYSFEANQTTTAKFNF